MDTNFESKVYLSCISENIDIFEFNAFFCIAHFPKGDFKLQNIIFEFNAFLCVTHFPKEDPHDLQTTSRSTRHLLGLIEL